MRLRVSPGARRTKARGQYGDGVLKLAEAAPPVDGKANAEIRRFLARMPSIPASAVEIVRGSSGRDKTAFVGNVRASEVLEALSGRVR